MDYKKVREKITYNILKEYAKDEGLVEYNYPDGFYVFGNPDSRKMADKKHDEWLAKQKTLTNMDYKEKLEEAKSLYESANDAQKYVLEILFPELKESQEERIRKALMQNLKERFGTKGNMGEGLDMPDVLAWLKKQGKKLDPDEVIAWLRSYGCHVDSIVADFKKQFKI